jgi:hypothetical protein
MSDAILVTALGLEWPPSRVVIAAAERHVLAQNAFDSNAKLKMEVKLDSD